jgi:alkanesulfonate monooxygenase SsuD/methylene tetrahydromethanopterin reductase-like flavin-dependent oxidoreductase (luciferase family)
MRDSAPAGATRSSVTGRPLKVGVQLPEVERVVRWPEIADMARAAEDVGLDSLWVGDHLLYRDERHAGAVGPWEAWTSLAGLAAVTKRIELGPLVAATAFHNPAMLAKQASTIDEISGGRLTVGLGAGWNEVEFKAFGFPYDQRISRFEEAFTIINTLLRDGAIDFDGRFFQVRDCELQPRSTRPGGPRLLIGSNGERMLRIGVPHVNAWNTWFSSYGNDPAGLAPLQANVDRACREAGRDPATLERTAAVLVRFPDGAGRPGASDPPVQGSPEQMADALLGFVAAGIDHVQLVIDPITIDSIKALGRVLEHLDRPA